MITRKVQFVPPSANPWIWTPEISPQLSPVISDCDADDEANMSADDLRVSRPISIVSPVRDGAASSSRPTLDEILNKRSQPPYTLSAFTAYLSQQHCLETLEFTMDAKQYQDKYAKSAAHLAGRPRDDDHKDVSDLQQDWRRLLDVYIKPGSPREINLPAEERDELLEQIYSEKPPEPEALEPSVKRMYDLMGDSIFMPFLNSFNPPPRANTFCSPGCDFGGRREGGVEVSQSLLENREELMHRASMRRRRSPPSTSKVDFSAARSPPSPGSHRHTQSSGITSAIGRASGSRLSTHVSNSSAVSGQEGGLTDDSGSVDSPGAGDPVTPPTTPPSSDLPLGSSHHRQPSPKPSRQDNGSWRKMGMKLLGRKRNGGTLRERPDEG